MIAPERRAEIEKELAALEQERGIRILHAIESGSRAWGFPSADSDYDVRIIYVHPRDWYVSVRERRDVIEFPISGDLDIAGWDLRKALRLMAGGNAVIHEWLGSPIVYRQDTAAFFELNAIAREVFDPCSSFHHYFAMSAKKLDVADGEPVTAKRFLYGLRTLLCARWVLERRTAPPMLFSELLEVFVPSSLPERGAIDALVRAKAEGSEKDIDGGLGGLVSWTQTHVTTLRAVEAPASARVDYEGVDEVLWRLIRL